MVERIVEKLVTRRYEEDIVSYIFRKQDMRNRITDFVESIVAGFMLVLMLLWLTMAYLMQPIEENPVDSGYSDPEAVTEWTLPEEN